MIVENFGVSNVGMYLCKASNSLGEASANVSISIRLAPTVKVIPNRLTLNDGETGALNCIVEGNYGEYTISWKDAHDIFAIKVNFS